MSLLRLCPLALGCLLAACSSSPSPAADASAPTDASSTDGAGSGDARRDSAPRAPSPIYGECNSDAECMEGLTCRTGAQGFPGGFCTRSCMTDKNCLLESFMGRRAVDGFCMTDPRTRARSCVRTCLNGEDCEREGYTCFTLNRGTLNEVNVCQPVCTDESCVNGTVCDRDSNRCRAADAPPPMGRGLGETCVPTGQPNATATNRCRSDQCNGEVLLDSMMRPVPTGWNGGYCISRCILPERYNSSTFWPDRVLPQSNCPRGGVCLPGSTLARGDLGTCLAECRSNSDCRVDQGYYCQKSIRLSSGMRTYDNGWCTLINCGNTMTPCPSGYMCRINPSSPASNRQGVCIPMTGGM